MIHKAKSIRAFIGAKDFIESRAFYIEMGFEEIIIDSKMSLFRLGDLAFYLQDAYVKDWIDNSMMFLEVDSADRYYQQIVDLNIMDKYENVKLTEVKTFDWGKECFMHDPSGVLWHFGEFN